MTIKTYTDAPIDYEQLLRLLLDLNELALDQATQIRDLTVQLAIYKGAKPKKPRLATCKKCSHERKQFNLIKKQLKEINAPTCSYIMSATPSITNDAFVYHRNTTATSKASHEQ